jgi:chromosome segregation ATPase
LIENLFFFVDTYFLNSLENLDGKQLLDIMQSFLSKGIVAGRKGYEKITADSRADNLRLLEENRKLREENERLKEESKHLTGQVQDLLGQCSKQKTAMDALKRELEKGLQCYEQCRAELRDTVDQLDASQVQITTRDALIDELKKTKAESEKTLEDNESYCHQWGGHVAHTYRRVLERYGAET